MYLGFRASCHSVWNRINYKVFILLLVFVIKSLVNKQTIVLESTIVIEVKIRFKHVHGNNTNGF